jgi:aldose 1-epimerase
MKKLVLVMVFVLAAGTLCFAQQKGGYVEPTSDKYRKVVDNKQVDLYTIKNDKGMVVKITNYGAKIEQIMVPDKNGTLADVVQGYESIDKAIGGQGSMGAFVGRYANRIGNAKFTLDGKEYQDRKSVV